MNSDSKNTNNEREGIETLETTTAMPQVGNNPINLQEMINNQTLTQSNLANDVNQTQENASSQGQVGVTASPIDVNVTGSQVPSAPEIDSNITAVPMPPTTDSEKKKKGKSSKVLFIILILVLIAAIGFGVYYFLHMSKEKTNVSSFTLKDMQIELGTTLPTELAVYGIFTDLDVKSCIMDDSAVEIGKTGEYDYSVTCNDVTKSAKIYIKDSIAPNVVTQNLTLLPSISANEVTANKFVKSCFDYSGCNTIEFTEEPDFATILKTEGSYELEIKVTDGNENITTKKVVLTISMNAPAKYISCYQEMDDKTSNGGTLTETFEIGMSIQNYFVNATRTISIVYSLEDYLKIKENYITENKIENYEGEVIFEDASYKVSIMNAMTNDELNTLNGSSIGTNYETIKNNYKQKGYICEDIVY